MTNKPAGPTKRIQQSLDSTLESVDQAEKLALEVAHECGFDEDERHKIGMSVRECMVNAVVHGNRYSAQKKVKFSVSCDRGRYEVRIADQGEGFDPDSVPDPLSDENLLRHSGRGVFLMRAFMDKFLVRRLKPSGTEVILVKNVVAPA